MITTPFFQEIANHLWQSTAVAAGIALLSLALQKNPARFRYSLWMAASLKFLLPFSLLFALGALPAAGCASSPGPASGFKNVGRDYRAVFARCLRQAATTG